MRKSISLVSTPLHRSESLSSFVTAYEQWATISVFQQGDNRTPSVMDWNITISQALPWRSVFEISYVGTRVSTN